jgi:hypothetical protein
VKNANKLPLAREIHIAEQLPSALT